MTRSVLQVATYSRALSSFVAPFAQFLQGRGYQVTLAASDEALSGPSTIDDLCAQGFDTVVVPFTNRLRPSRDCRAAGVLFTLLKKRRFDLVHTYTAKAGVIGRLTARAARVPVIVHTAFSWPQLDDPSKAFLYGPLEQMSARACDHIFCISRLGYRQAMDLGIRPRRGISCPGIGLDLAAVQAVMPVTEARQALKLPVDVPLVGTAARLVPHKRVGMFLSICRLIADRVPEARFFILGDGPERSQLVDLATQLRLTDRVTFIEHFTESQYVTMYLRALDVFVLPTEREGFGMVFAEAMTQETPVVAPRRAPIDEIVGENEGGILVAADTAEAYAAAVVALLSNDDERHSLGTKGRRRIFDHFDRQTSYAEIEGTYQALLDSPGRLGIQ